MAPIVHILNVGDWSTLLNKNGDKLVVVDFTATWCGPCKRIAPLFENLSRSTPNSVFAKVDVDEAQDVAQACSVRSMPTFQFYKSGQLLRQFSGADDAQLKATIAEFAQPVAFAGAGRTLADDTHTTATSASAGSAPNSRRATQAVADGSDGLHPACLSIAIYGAFLVFICVMLIGNPGKVIGVFNAIADIVGWERVVPEQHAMWTAMTGALGFGVGAYYLGAGLANNLQFAKMTVGGRFFFLAMMIYMVATGKTSAGFLPLPIMDVLTALVTRHFLKDGAAERPKQH